MIRHGEALELAQELLGAMLGLEACDADDARSHIFSRANAFIARHEFKHSSFVVVLQNAAVFFGQFTQLNEASVRYHNRYFSVDHFHFCHLERIKFVARLKNSRLVKVAFQLRRIVRELQSENHLSPGRF